MNGPICEFVEKYAKETPVRFHMPGHKGHGPLGIEKLDITEIDGADSLYGACGIIAESESDASKIFGADTFYSTEGSTLCIKAMLRLIDVFAKSENRRTLIAATRNAHKAFLNGAALLGIDIAWLCPENSTSYLSCDINAAALDSFLESAKEKPVAVYITSPDYLGNVADIQKISNVCKKHSCLLAVDNAHGAYLKFLSKSRHPIDLGADICCDSAHKTLPVLTGGAYLHVSKKAPVLLKEKAKQAMSLFASTSPSYLILQSLDSANSQAEEFKGKLCAFVPTVDKFKASLVSNGYALYGDEPMKITIQTKKYGYVGYDFYGILKKNGIVAEFCDPDFTVLMLSPENRTSEFRKLAKILMQLPKRDEIETLPQTFEKAKIAMTPRAALLSESETVRVEDAVGRISAQPTVSCPPAVPIAVSGEVITQNTAEAFKYYGIETCEVVK